MNTLQSLRTIWEKAFFPKESALNLAAARIIFSVQALWVLLSRDIPAISSVPPVFWHDVRASDAWRYLVFPGHASIEYGVEVIAIMALIAAAFGLWTRISCLIAALALFHFAGLETLFWTANPYQRGFTVSVPALLTLSLARCDDALVFRTRRVVELSTVYGWPMRLCQLYLAQVYLWSAWSKLDRVGIAWMAPDNLRRWFLMFSQQDQLQMLSPFFHWLGPWIAEHWILSLAAGIIGMGIDLIFIVAVFFPRSRRWIIPEAFLFHVAVVLTFNIFFNNIPQLLIFVNWPWAAEKLKRLRSSRQSHGQNSYA
jgi:hypothetical protein